MKSFRNIIALAIALAVIAAASVTALAAEYGSGAVVEGQEYTVEQMLTYAMEDEYMAQAQYQAIADEFDAARPFTNIVRAEQNHIDLLTPLFEQYGVAVPENTAANSVTIPETLELAYEAAVQAENSNIAMYTAFLKQELPDDVKQVFEALLNASENHLNAFERGGDCTGNGQRMGGNGNCGRGNNGNGWGNGRGNGCGNRGNGNRGNNGQNCGNCLVDQA